MNKITPNHKFIGYWISMGKTMMVPTPNTGNAPIFRKTFSINDEISTGKVYLCGLGWHELYINGKKVDNRVLAPTVTRFEVRANYIVYDVKELLKKGENCIAVILGNGWYNCQSTQKFSFDKAPWRDFPKLICDVIVNDYTLVFSNEDWKYTNSPITYDALRSGECYDARLEIPNFADVKCDDTTWNQAKMCFPPGGIIEEEKIEPCQVMQRIKPIGATKLFPYVTIYDFGVNLTGWCEIKVSGKAGDVITLDYAEKVRANGDIDNSENGMYITETPFQHDSYTLKGDGIEVWHPRFTYHGFRYVKVVAKGITLHSIEGHFIHTNFEPVGSFTTDSPYINKLHDNIIRSYLANFTGIPTDCPHREKNGWTGDAHLGCSVGLWNFDSKNAYHHFLRLLTDCQRRNGQLPCIAPTGGTYGFNWGAGPSFDYMLFEGVAQLWRFYGDKEIIKEFYDNMARYLDFCQSMEVDNLVSFGLTDWAHPEDPQAVPLVIVASSFYYKSLSLMSSFADILKKKDDYFMYRNRAELVREALKNKFSKEDGSCNNNSLTELACAIYFDFSKNASKTAALLVQKCREVNHKAIFGIVGAKIVPRVLASYGYIEDAYKILTQEEFPGWGYSIKQGATTLWEQWNGINSQCHIMYGNIDSFMYEYIAGIKIKGEAFSEISFIPCFVKDLNYVKAHRKLPNGEVSIKWTREGKKITLECFVPEGSKGIIHLSGTRSKTFTGMKSKIIFED